MKIKKETVIRTSVLISALINQTLTIFGKNPLPWSENEIYNGMSMIITAASALWAWWKNNSFTKKAIEADEYLEVLRSE